MIPGLGRPPKVEKKIPTIQDHLAAGSEWMSNHRLAGYLTMVILAPGLAVVYIIGRLVYKDV